MFKRALYIPFTLCIRKDKSDALPGQSPRCKRFARGLSGRRMTGRVRGRANSFRPGKVLTDTQNAYSRRAALRLAFAVIKQIQPCRCRTETLRFQALEKSVRPFAIGFIHPLRLISQICRIFLLNLCESVPSVDKKYVQWVWARSVGALPRSPTSAAGGRGPRPRLQMTEVADLGCRGRPLSPRAATEERWRNCRCAR